MIRKIMGIDHAIRYGMALYIENEGDISIETFTNTLTCKDNNDKFIEWYKVLNNSLDLYKPDVICTEQPKHLRNPKVLQFLTGLYTITILVAKLKGITVVECNPKTVKKAITGNGNALKEDVMNALRTEYNLTHEDLCHNVYYKDGIRIKEIHYDKSDALALVHYYLHI